MENEIKEIRKYTELLCILSNVNNNYKKAIIEYLDLKSFSNYISKSMLYNYYSENIENYYIRNNNGKFSLREYESFFKIIWHNSYSNNNINCFQQKEFHINKENFIESFFKCIELMKEETIINI